MYGVCKIFLHYTREIHRKSTPKDPNFLQISMACGKIEQFIESACPGMTQPSLASMKLAAERADAQQRTAGGDTPMSPEDRRELYWIYAAIAGMWLVILALTSGIAWMFGARFDFLVQDISRILGGLTGGHGAGPAPGHGEL